MKVLLRTLALTVQLGLIAGLGFAFEWSPGEFPSGNQSYTLEFRIGDGESAERATLQYDIVESNGAYEVTTTMTSERSLDRGELDIGSLTGGAFGMGALGPALIFGPTFMVMPILLEDRDIRVRNEPVELPGMGRLHMPESVQIAGKECVVVRFEPPGEQQEVVEFALAEGLPFPCYSRYGSGEDSIEVRLLEAR